jgi:hypothetical protein
MGWLVQRLANARADAERIAGELTSGGHLTAEQAAALESAVEAAVAKGRELLGDALREPRRIADALRRRAPRADRGGAEDGGEGKVAELLERVAELAERTAEIEARLARLERTAEPAVSGGSGRGS